MDEFEAKKKLILEKFSINDLTDHQKEAIIALRKGQDVFVGTKTGSGKSLIYECAPIAFKDRGVTIVLAPLTSIMKEQVERLNKLGFNAVYVSGETDKDAVVNGYYQFVFGSPEIFVGDSKWREILKSPSFASSHTLIVVDEAHTVIQWGLESHKEEPFRKWFGHIGELRSLCIGVPLLALTATASPSHRRKIIQNLCFKQPSCVIVDSPDRKNIKISVQKVKNNTELANVFQWITSGLIEKKQDFPRHLIFCNSIKDCAQLYMLFLKELGNNDYFDMYHSKTTESTKEKIRNDMLETGGKIRILICTNAAGMGVNFQCLNNIIHYGPPRELDTLVQQMGRAGRDGTASNELIVYRSNQLKKIDDDVLKLLKSSECRRKILTEAYMHKVTKMCKHLCCDICESTCKCKDDVCPNIHPSKQFIETEDETDETEMKREITHEEETIILQKLLAFRDSVTEGANSLIHVDFIIGFSVDEVMEKLPVLFTTDDILDKTTISSFSVAEKICTIINETLGDTELYECVEDMEIMESDTE